MAAFKEAERVWLEARRKQLDEAGERRNWLLYGYAGPDEEDVHRAYARKKKAENRSKRHLNQRLQRLCLVEGDGRGSCGHRYISGRGSSRKTRGVVRIVMR